MRIVVALALAVLVPACSSEPDAQGQGGGGTDAASMSDDVGAGTDLAQDTSLDDAGAPVCPSVGGGYTVLIAPTGTCPAGGPNSYGFSLALDEPTCVVSFSGSDDALNILHLTGSSMIDEGGDFGPVAMTLNDTAVTCTGDFTAASPNTYAFDCSGCLFTIRFGE